MILTLPLLAAAVQAAPPKFEKAPTGADVRLLFSYDDYPAEALQKNEQGTVQAELTIDPDGRVTACKVVRSSNSTALDTATCNIMMRRAKFTPARDANGNPTVDTYLTPPVTWRIEEKPAGPQMELVQPGRYRCAPSGQWGLGQDIVALKPGQEMRIAFRLLAENPALPRPPVAGITIETVKGATNILVGQSVNDAFQMFVALNLPGKPQRELYEFPLTKNWIILRLTLDNRGLLTIRNNDQDQRFPIGSASVSRTSLHCNSGDWEIDLWPRSYVPAAKGN